MSPHRSARAVGYRDNRGVGGSQRKALMRIHQVCHPRKVGARQVDRREVPIGEGLQEQRLHAGTGLARQEVADLSDDSRWHQQFAPGRMQRAEQLNACLMPCRAIWYGLRGPASVRL